MGGAAVRALGNVEIETSDTLLYPAEVAALFGVSPRTVARWAREGKIPAVRTAGGHHRYRPTDVDALMHNGNGKAPS